MVDRRDKVIIVNYTGRKGGGSLDAYEMTKALIESGNNVVAIISEYCCNRNKWEQLDLTELIFVKTYRNKKEFIKNSIKFWINSTENLKKLKDKYRVEYIYCPMLCLWTNKINNLVGKEIPVCAVNHDPIPHSGSKTWFISLLFGENRVYRKSRLVIVHSRVFIDYVDKKFKKDRNVVYMPLGKHDIDVEIKEVKRNYYATDKINFLFFGRIEKYKGLEILIDAFEELKKELKDITLTIVGSGDCKKFQGKIEKNQIRLENRWIADEEIPMFFSGCNLVLVLPYIDATQSGPAMFALEYGIPTICTATGGLPEQIQHGVAGIVIPPSDVMALKQAMLDIAVNKELRMQLSEGAKKSGAERDWGKQAIRLVNEMRRRL